MIQPPLIFFFLDLGGIGYGFGFYNYGTGWAKGSSGSA